MQIDLAARTWQSAKCAAFMRSRESHGDLSNMTFGFPLQLNGLTFQGPEGLYQALKFPSRPDAQQAIASQRSGMEAKRLAYRHGALMMPTEERERIKTSTMTVTLAEKLAQHPERFGRALRNTGTLPIVERSYRDPWWGAQPRQDGTLRGVNVLGQLLTILRDLHLQNPAQAAHQFRRMAHTENLLLNGLPL